MLLAAADASAAVVLAMLMPSLLGARGLGEPIAVDPSYMASNMLTAATRVRLLPSGHAPRTATSLLLPFTAHMRGAPPRLVLAAAVLLLGEPAAAGTISVSNKIGRIISALEQLATANSEFKNQLAVRELLQHTAAARKMSPLLLNALLATTLTAGPQIIAPQRLRVEYEVAPLGLDVKIPRFSWALGASGAPRGLVQAAYAIEVVALDTNTTLWTSGMVLSNRSTNVRYAPAAQLPANGAFSWRVRWWSDARTSPSAWTPYSRFTTGLSLTRTGPARSG